MEKLYLLVLAIGYKDFSINTDLESINKTEDFTFIGFAGFRNFIRSDLPQVIKYIKNSDI